MTTHEEKIQAAVADLKAGVFDNIQQAAYNYEMPPTTLRGRLSGVPTCHEAHAYQQLLTDAQERVVVD